MANSVASPLIRSRTDEPVERSSRNEASSSSVSWAAVIGGAVAAAAVSLILLALGTGVGLSAVSPRSNADTTATVGKVSIIWLVVTQIIASAIGGYLAGRLRTKWVNIHSDEVYFRDTAHGFLAWAVGLVITAAFLTSAAMAMVGGAGTLASTKSLADTNSYYVDSMFRSDRANTNADDTGVRAEAWGILANGLRQPDFPAGDKAYLTQLVATQTGVSQIEAERRVTETINEARQTEETARKAAAHLSYWTFFALLVGAFCASLAATFGGRQRDRVPAV